MIRFTDMAPSKVLFLKETNFYLGAFEEFFRTNVLGIATALSLLATAEMEGDTFSLSAVVPVGFTSPSLLSSPAAPPHLLQSQT